MDDQRDYAEEAANRADMEAERVAELEAEAGLGGLEAAVRSGQERANQVAVAVAACGNRWHRTESAGKFRTCPECPSEIRTAVLARFGWIDSDFQHATGEILTIHPADAGTHHTWMRSNRDGIRTTGRVELTADGWKVQTDAEQALANARLKTQHALELARHNRIQRELGLVRALVKAFLAARGTPLSPGETLEIDDAGEGWFSWGYEGVEVSLWGPVSDGPDGWEVKIDPDCAG